MQSRAKISGFLCRGFENPVVIVYWKWKWEDALTMSQPKNGADKFVGLMWLLELSAFQCEMLRFVLP